MARNQPTQGPDPVDETGSLGRRRAARLLVPVGVAGMAALTIGLVPALANSGGDPDLPDVSAEKLLTRLASTKVENVSGTVEVSTDLGLPGGLLAGGASGAGGSPFGPGAGGEDGEDGEDQADKGGPTADPREKLTELLSGTHTVRVAAAGEDRQRVSIVEDAAEYSITRNGDDVWAYDSASNRVFHSKVSEAEAAGHKDGRRHGGKLPEDFPATPQEAADQVLKALDGNTSVTVDGTTEVAGRDAYKLRFAPKESSSTVEAVTIAVDADNGAPLKFTLTPKSGGKAVLDIGFTDVSFDKPAAKTFEFTPPKGAKVTEADPGDHRAEHLGPKDFAGQGLSVIGEGWNSVAEMKLPKGTLSGEAFKDAKGAKDLPAGFDPGALLESLGDQVDGDFGKGTVISTRLVNVLVTDDGRVFAGAVDKDALVEAAEK